MPYSWVVSYSYACIPLCTGWLDLSLQSPPQNQEIPLFWKHCPWEVMLTQHHSSLWFMKENPTQGKNFIFHLVSFIFIFIFIYLLLDEVQFLIGMEKGWDWMKKKRESNAESHMVSAFDDSGWRQWTWIQSPTFHVIAKNHCQTKPNTTVFLSKFILSTNPDTKTSKRFKIY